MASLLGASLLGVITHALGAIQELRNTMGVSDFPQNNVTKVYLSTLLALREGRWVSNFQGKRYLNGLFTGGHVYGKGTQQG